MADELQRFASGCGAGASVGGALGAAVGTIIPGAGTVAGGAIGGALACLGAGAVAAWSGQTQPLAPVGGGAVTAQVPITQSGVQSKGGGTMYAGGSPAGWEARYESGASTPASTTNPSGMLPLLLGGALLAAVVLFAVSRRRW